MEHKLQYNCSRVKEKIAKHHITVLYLAHTFKRAMCWFLLPFLRHNVAGDEFVQFIFFIMGLIITKYLRNLRGGPEGLTHRKTLFKVILECE